MKAKLFSFLFAIFCEKLILTETASCNNSYVPFGNSCDECGKTYNQPNLRIVGGTLAVPHSWPAQVLIIQNIKGYYKFYSWLYTYTYTITSKYMCAGTLINRYTVLSAAHCIKTSFIAQINGYYYNLNVNYDYYPTLESMFDIYVGADYIGSLSSLTKMSVKKIIKHKDYNDTTNLNDVSLFILNEPVVLNQNVQPACLTNSSYTLNQIKNTSAFASGWGALNESGSSANYLYNVKLTIYDGTKCANVTYFNTASDSQLCAGEYNGGKDTCQGDSGGGLYVFDSNSNKYVLAGITSYGKGCARAGFPGVYTRVSYFYDWIVSNWYTGAFSDSTLMTTTLTEAISMTKISTSYTSQSDLISDSKMIIGVSFICTFIAVVIITVASVKLVKSSYCKFCRIKTVNTDF